MVVGRQIQYFSRRGTIHYTPSDPEADNHSSVRFPEPPFRPRQVRPRSIHITRFPAGLVYIVPPSQPETLQDSRFRREIRKLASRENAKRVLGSVFSSLTSSSSSSSAAAAGSAPPSNTEPSNQAQQPLASLPAYYDFRQDTPSAEVQSARPARRDTAMPASQEARIAQGSDAVRSSASGSSRRKPPHTAAVVRPPNSVHIPEADRPVATATGVSCSILLDEPHIYLTGFEHDRNHHPNSTAMIRGTLLLDITKSTKIKTVTLTFSGKARTEWPEGIPPAKAANHEELKLRQQVLPFFNSTFADSDDGYGAQCTYQLRNPGTSISTTSLTDADRSAPSISSRSSRSSTLLSVKDQKRLSLQTVQSRSFQKGDSPFPTAQQKGFKTFHPGTYKYRFEIPLDHTTPETIKLPLGSVRWMLEALVERAGTFKQNLHGTKEVLVIRAPDQNSLEQVEPIAISRKWEDQLHYDIVISGKSFPIGSKIPIAFKLTPLAKVQCHRIKVYVTENVDYYTEDKRVTRRDAVRKILLFERQAGKGIAKEYASSELRTLAGGELSPEQRAEERRSALLQREREARRTSSSVEPLPEPTDNLLGDLDLGLDHLIQQTELEMEVQLPTCAMMSKDRTKALHPDTTWKLIQVHHWIKVVLRLSRIDKDDPTGKKRRHFEISIDSPFHILSCLTTQAHTSLPEYTNDYAGSNSQLYACGCPNAAVVDDASGSSSGSIPTLGSMSQSSGFGVDSSSIPGLAALPLAHLPSHGGDGVQRPTATSSSGLQRPIHLLRSPSFNPPAFDEEEPPPPLATPPPGYDMVIGTPSHDGLADYFARLADAYSDDEATDDEDTNRSTSRSGRVNIVNPRTPGSATSRSMDLDRGFMLRPEGFDLRLQGMRRSERPSVTG